jgi:type IV pilus assembly protein PilP
MTPVTWKRMCVMAGAACFCAWLTGCGGAESPPPPVPPAPKASTPSPAPPAANVPATATETTPPALDEAAEPPPHPMAPYAYIAEGRRDPFRSIIVSAERQRSEELLHPLQKYSIKDLRLVAIVWGGFGSSAMLQTPDGKGYSVRSGMTVGNRDGVVKKIQPDHIVVEERYTDIFGERKEQQTVIDLHPPEEGPK